jgi:NADPH:quinone reductase-like Zn-dependent oxidoreductase
MREVVTEAVLNTLLHGNITLLENHKISVMFIYSNKIEIILKICGFLVMKGVVVIDSFLGFADAATLPLEGTLAYQALKKDARLSPGQSLLILGGHNGVGLLAIQMAK